MNGIKYAYGRGEPKLRTEEYLRWVIHFRIAQSQLLQALFLQLPHSPD